MSTNYYLAKETDIGVIEVIHLGKSSSYKGGSFASNFLQAVLRDMVVGLLQSPQNFRIIDEYRQQIDINEFLNLIIVHICIYKP